MRGKYSPTISERYVDRLWWFRNGGGYGLLEDGSQMSDTYFHFDHEGYDQFGYDRHGRDRAGNSLRDYEASEDLFAETAAAVTPTGKATATYWPLVTAVASAMAERFPSAAILHPQDDAVTVPNIRIHVAGGYAVRLGLEDAGGFERSLEVRFDDGTGGSSRTDRCWSAVCIDRSGGEARSEALCMVDTAGEVLEFALAAVRAYDPDRDLFDIAITEGGDGTVSLQAVPRAKRAGGDLLGAVYSPDAEAALVSFASRCEPGGVLARMAAKSARGLELSRGTDALLERDSATARL